MTLTERYFGKYTYAGAAALLTILVFLPALGNGFVDWDDGEYVFENLHIRSFDAAFLRWAFFDFHSQNWHPLTWISHAIDYALWGLNPLGHHLTSVLLHGGNAFLVTILAVILYTRSTEVSGTGISVSQPRALAVGLATGLLFSLHPLRVESVAWVSERKDLLCGFFFLLSILAHIRFGTGHTEIAGGLGPVLRNRWYWLSLVCFALALLSKPMAIMLPVVLLVLDWYPLGRFRGLRQSPRPVLEKAPFFALSLLSAKITMAAQGHVIRPAEPIALFGRVLVAIKALALYLFKTIWPLNLSPLYPYPARVSPVSISFLVPLLVVAGITVFCIVALKWNKAFLAAWAYYGVTLLPVLGIIQVASIAMADRYSYLPSIGPVLLLGCAVPIVFDRARDVAPRTGIVKIAAVLGAAAVLILLSFTTIRQIRIWKDSAFFWTRVIEEAPDYTKAYDARGAVYGSRGALVQAIDDFDTAIRLDPAYWRAYYNRGLAHLFLKQYAEAARDFTEALHMKVQLAEVYYYRGGAFAGLGRLEEALADYTEAIALGRTDVSRYYYQRAAVLDRLGRTEAAMKDRRDAVAAR